jgi:ATP-dependent Clp protease adaptor protein ClpS
MREEKPNSRLSGAIVAEPKRRVTKPSMYKVRLLNDDFTPMDFVVYVVQKFFHKSHDESLSIALQIHNTGSAVCGFYTRDVAETKVGIVNDYARKSQHPLKCTLEENQ